MRLASSRAARPGGIAKVSAGDSMIAGPGDLVARAERVLLVDRRVGQAVPPPDRPRALRLGRAGRLGVSSGSAGFSTSAAPVTITFVIR